MSYSDLKGKTFIVTGAASGMGRTLSLMLAQQGANVGLLDLRQPHEVLAEITGSGGQGLALACNVQDRKAVDDAVRAVAQKFGGLHGGANMAGWVGTQGLTGKGYMVEVLDDADWDKMLATNLNGVKNCLRAEIQNMKEGGSIVNAASIAGQLGEPFNSPYTVSKWGVIGLTKVAAKEVGEKGIRVNAVAPGVVKTPLTQALGQMEELESFMKPRIALRRLAEPEDVTKVILFLLSDEAAYITASVVNIDGGFS